MKKQTPLSGSAIELARHEMGLTCAAMSDALGVSRMTLLRWESEGMVRGYSSPAGYALRWLLTLPSATLEALGARVKETGSAELALLKLYFITSHSRAS